MKKIAIVDVGSNTIRLSVYHVRQGGGFSLLFSEKETAGLNNYISGHVLSEEGIGRACYALENFRELLAHFEIYEMHAFATASLRNIENTEEAVARIRGITGVGVEVISGKEESRLGVIGAIRGVPMKDGAFFDIGGGSTELAEIKNGVIGKPQSIPIGSLQLFNHHVDKIWPKKKEVDEIRLDIHEAMKEASVSGLRDSTVCGIGGTARAIGKIAGVLFGQSGGENSKRIAKPAVELTERELDLVTATLLRRDRLARSLVLKACPDRIHTIFPGLLLVNEVFRIMDGRKLVISQFGVREGYLTRLIPEVAPELMRSPEAADGGGQ